MGFSVGAVTPPLGRLMGRCGFLAGAASPVWRACRRAADVTVFIFSSSHSSFVTAAVLFMILGRRGLCGLFTSCTAPTVGGGRAQWAGRLSRDRVVCGRLWAEAATHCKDSIVTIDFRVEEDVRMGEAGRVTFKGVTA